MSLVTTVGAIPEGRRSTARSLQSHTNYHAGLLAEDIVARHYGLRGHGELARRWRGRSGELDLVLRDGDGVIVVEVKKAKTHDAARGRVSPRQAQRIARAASEYVAMMPTGQLTDIRVDLATVDSIGSVEVIENASMMF